MATDSATGFEGFPWCGRWRFGAAMRAVHWRIVTEIFGQQHTETT
jgi:hypothetical protein